MKKLSIILLGIVFFIMACNIPTSDSNDHPTSDSRDNSTIVAKDDRQEETISSSKKIKSKSLHREGTSYPLKEEFYNEEGKLIRELEFDIGFKYTYDGKGRLLTKVMIMEGFDDMRIKSFSYSGTKEIEVSYTNGVESQKSTRYLNGEGVLIKEKVKGGEDATWDYSYDDEGRLQKITKTDQGKRYDAELYEYGRGYTKIESFDEYEALKLTKILTKDKKGNLISDKYIYPSGGGGETQRTYNKKGKLTEIKSLMSGNELSRVEYVYDKQGFLSQEILYKGGAKSSLRSYRYTFFE